MATKKRVVITKGDKKEMVRLHSKGYTATNIGKAFGISRQAVAAHVAWHTMKNA
jgi:DNA-binding CsgD family transcriptional regulator